MTQLSRRAALVTLAAVAGAGVALPASTPLGRLLDDDDPAATGAVPDPAITVGYRILPWETPTTTPDGTASGAGANDSSPDGGQPSATPTPPESATPTPSADPALTGWRRGSPTESTTTVDRDDDGRTRLVTRATTPTVPLEAVTPGSGGTLALGVSVGDTPVWLSLRTDATDDENGVGESEAAAGDTTPDAGELAAFLGVRLVVVPEDGGSDTVFEGTLAGLLAATAADGDGLAVAGGRPDGAWSPGASCEVRLEWTFLGDAAAFAARGLPVPGDVNVTQSDRLDLSVTITAQTVA
ncbi:hypothetical protein [Halobaculum marinum]|uniref:SipW-cognate class signal peptide n=1 Tax=Halobaculum marinum TaxID=3031996 RepID=A0ABD5WYL7_9EURY|nr:hypothetical protein [Halobaculum sp. DT55]